MSDALDSSSCSLSPVSSIFTFSLSSLLSRTLSLLYSLDAAIATPLLLCKGFQILPLFYKAGSVFCRAPPITTPMAWAPHPGGVAEIERHNNASFAARGLRNLIVSGDKSGGGAVLSCESCLLLVYTGEEERREEGRKEGLMKRRR